MATFYRTFFYTLSDFQSIPEQKQQLALQKAVMLADHEEGEYTIYLFQLDSFYVEVYCHKEDPLPGRYYVFNCTDRLEPYFTNMPIDLILQ
jgi:hypothetical protein